MRKRILCISDTHSGHHTGLTTPEFENPRDKSKLGQMRREQWREFNKAVAKHGPYDMAFHLGDCVDGKGKRSGGVEQITTSMDGQTDMAVAVCDHIRLYGKRGFKWYGVSGTPYHISADGDDWDDIMSNRAGFESFSQHEWIDVNGCVFDLKHKIGSSSIPHGRHTAAARARIQNILWGERQPRAQVFLRGHVHYHSYCGGADWLAMTMPALQGWTKYGAAQCEGTIDWGFVVFDVDDKGRWDWHAETQVLKTHNAKAVIA